MNPKPVKNILVSITIFLFMLACLSSAPEPTATQAVAQPITATINEIQGEVTAKQPSELEFTTAQDGFILQVNGEAQTGVDGRARVNLSTGTFFRAGPSTYFILETLEENNGSPFTKLKLNAGKVWIILTAGSIEVETPGGSASVTGSYLSVETLSDNKIKITCLEGDCGFKNDNGEIKLVAGQMAIVKNIDTAPETGNMSEEDFNEWLTVNPEAKIIIPAVTATQGALPKPAPIVQPVTAPQNFGPDQSAFPSGYNALSGLQVERPDLLQYPALLISVSHFPAVARPQAGLSFAPWVFEFYITEGATRFLAAFHGEFPQAETPIHGDCEIRKMPFEQNNLILGNQVWNDKNKNGRQEPYERGIGGVCVNLFNATGVLIDSTTTDSNGYYGFNVSPAKYTIEFILPNGFAFTESNLGDENADSDADMITGRADAEIQSTHLFLDAGMIPSEDKIASAIESSQMPKGEVGPIRSGRLIYADIAGFFPSSCLIYASASKEVLEKIPQCSFVTHEDAGGGSMMPLERFEAVAKDNMGHTAKGFTYSGNAFSEEPPAGGVPAKQINVFVALLNQSGWTYDPVYGSWLRFVDNAEEKTAGELHPEVDRLTGRQLHFENLIIITAEHDVISPTNLDIHLEQGEEGPAVLFRDGAKYDIKWSTRAGKYEQQTGLRRPMQFLNADGSLAQLKPGATWIFVATPFSILSDEGSGVWKLRFYAPAGAR